MNSLLCWQMFELGRICALWEDDYRLARYSDKVRAVAHELSEARDDGSELIALAKLDRLADLVLREAGNRDLCDVYLALALVPMAR